MNIWIYKYIGLKMSMLDFPTYVETVRGLVIGLLTFAAINTASEPINNISMALWTEMYLNIKLSYLLAGASGGIVRAFLIGPSLYAAISSVVVGTLTAGYMSPGVAAIYAKMFSVTPDANFNHGVAFVIGVTAMLICEGLIGYTRRWARNPTVPGGGA